MPRTQPCSIACANSSSYSIPDRRKVNCGSSNPGVFESTSRPMRKRNKRDAAPGALGLDGGRARARQLGVLGGDELRASGARFQPARHAGPPGFQPNGTSAHWDFSEDTYRTLTAVPPPFPPPLGGGLGGASRSRPAGSSRSAGCATCRSSPLSTSSTARLATRSTFGRDRAVSGARRDPSLVADRHGARLSRHL